VARGRNFEIPQFVSLNQHNGTVVVSIKPTHQLLPDEWKARNGRLKRDFIPAKAIKRDGMDT